MGSLSLLGAKHFACVLTRERGGGGSRWGGICRCNLTVTHDQAVPCALRFIYAIPGGVPFEIPFSQFVVHVPRRRLWL